MSFYSLGLTMLGQKFKGSLLASANASFIFLFVFRGNHWSTGNWDSYGPFWPVCFRLVDGVYFSDLLTDLHLCWSIETEMQ